MSLEIMKDPVSTRAGQTYERDEIERWLEDNGTRAFALVLGFY